MTKDEDEIKRRDQELPGYQSSPPGEDIFRKYDQDPEVNPENPYEQKDPIERDTNEFSEDLSLGDLDIPGAEEDDQMESVGSEDEENNYYSLGSDDNDSLDTDSQRSDYTP
ncbi:MAG TPA: hypothetical protein VK212_00530 [Lentimicrobium sp.]|nr:hypothetical protein [Lentimicrobium sp.]